MLSNRYQICIRTYGGFINTQLGIQNFNIGRTNIWIILVILWFPQPTSLKINDNNNNNVHVNIANVVWIYGYMYKYKALYIFNFVISLRGVL